MAKATQPSLLLVAVTNFGVVAATADLGGVLAPELVPLVEPPPLDDEEEPPVEPVPAGGLLVPPDAVLAGAVVVPLAAVSVVDAPELAALLEPQALSAAKHTIEIAGKSKTRSFETKIIATCSHSKSCDHAECRWLSTIEFT
jgi:hypothetical protein